MLLLKNEWARLTSFIQFDLLEKERAYEDSPKTTGS